MFSFVLKFLLFIIVVFEFDTSSGSNVTINYSACDETCCEARLWPNECHILNNGSSRNDMSHFCKLTINLCCLLDQNNNVLCDPRSHKFVPENICKLSEHCCVACQIGEELADHRSDCVATELKKFITKQDALVLKTITECCKQKNRRRQRLRIEELLKARKVLRFNRSTNKTEDVNECLIKHNGCHRSQTCVNEYGSYYCQPQDVCKNGYRFDEFSLTCNDIDECHERRWACPTGEVCNNLLGSFTCYNPSCPGGYKVSSYKRWSNYNKCVRKSCTTHAERGKCQKLPKYLIYKNVSLSMYTKVINGFALYTIYTKRFRTEPSYFIDVSSNDSGAHVEQHYFGIEERPTSTVVFLKKSINVVQDVTVTVAIKVAGKVTEIVTINLSVREN